MNRDFLDRERTPREMMLFAAVALGLLVSAAGLVLSSVPMALAGLALGGLGFTGFTLQKG